MEIKRWNYKKKYNKLLVLLIFAMVGMTCNFLVVQANEGIMPVYYKYNISTNVHKTLNNYEDINEVKYLYLADIYPLGDILIFSIGDLLMIIALYKMVDLMIVHTLIIDYLDKRRLKKNGK